MRDSNGPIIYRYTFAFPDRKSQEFEVRLDPKTFDLVGGKRDSYPSWVKLGESKCGICPLDETAVPCCPVAASISDVIEFFREGVSCDQVEVTVDAPERRYVKRTSLEDGISAFIGIHMVTSGCPVLGKLKPLVRFHLPFATLDETRSRALSTYLLAQYLVSKQGKEPDWGLQRLSRIYNEVRLVNKGFSERLLGATVNDAGVNALVRLDCFAIHVSFLLDKNAFSGLEEQLKPFME